LAALPVYRNNPPEDHVSLAPLDASHILLISVLANMYKFLLLDRKKDGSKKEFYLLGTLYWEHIMLSLIL
jgi:hypothetical protein